MAAGDKPTVTLAVWIGDDGLVHLTGQAGPGPEGRLHIHVHQPAQRAKLRRFLDAQATGCARPGPGPGRQAVSALTLADPERPGFRLNGRAPRAARQEAGWTLEGLAAKLRVMEIGPGFSASRLSNVETGQDARLIGEWPAQVLAVALHVPLSILLRLPARLDPPVAAAGPERVVLRRLIDDRA